MHSLREIMSKKFLFQASKFHLLLGKSEGFSVSQIRKERDTISHHLLSAGQQPRPWQDLSVSLAFLSFWQLLELSADSVQFSLWPCIWFYAMPCCLTERFLAWLHCSPITQKLLAFCSPGKGRLCIPLWPCILNQCLPSAYLYGISGTTRLKEIIQKENTGTMKIGHNTRVGTRSLGTMGSLPQQRALSKAMHFPICHKAYGGCWLSGGLYCSLTFW